MLNLPPYNQFPAIKGDRITLRQIKDSDITEIIDISFYDGKQATSYEEAKVMQDNINSDYTEGNSIHWAVVDNDTNRIVGTCGYYRGFDFGKGELGCVLLPPYRGKGYMTTALEMAISFGKKDMGLTKIIAITTLQNTKAIALLERLDFKLISSTPCNNLITYEWGQASI
jgi:[ribosomal protein S5]-alanine N-acetyltransferase